MLIVSRSLALASDRGPLRNPLSRARLNVLRLLIIDLVSFTLVRSFGRRSLSLDLEKSNDQT